MATWSKQQRLSNGDLENDNQYQRSFYYYLWWFGGFVGTVILAGFSCRNPFLYHFPSQRSQRQLDTDCRADRADARVLETMSYVMVLEYPSGVVGEQFLTLVQHSMGW